MTYPGQQSAYQGPYPGPFPLLTRAEADALYASAASQIANYVLKSNIAVNVKDYGAVGNGITDDTTSLQNALTAGAGKSVYVPPGTYITSNALTVPSGTKFFGAGASSIIKSNALASGGSSSGQRQIDVSGSTNFEIADLQLDCSGLTLFLSGVRCIFGLGSSNFRIYRCRFKTPGAATALPNCSDYWVTHNKVEVISSDSAAHHDGIIDQWYGSHSFVIDGNVIYGNSIGLMYGVLVTGQATDGITATPCYDFQVVNNRIINVLSVGIWANGRQGQHYDFAIANNVVRNAGSYYGLAVSDARQFTVTGNVIEASGGNGIRLYSENGGTTGCQGGVVSNNVVIGANASGSVDPGDGAAINVTNNSASCIIANNRVKGTTHTYGVVLGASTATCEVVGNNYDTGTQGTVRNLGPTSNRIPGGGVYTPTLTSVANVSASTPWICRWSRDANVVTVYGRLEVTPTSAASVVTQLGISLPIASNLQDNTRDLGGLANTAFGVHGAIVADTTNDRAQLGFQSTNTASNSFYFTFQYNVL